VVEDSQAHRRDVQLGIIKGDQIEIVSGLAPGEKLVVAGHRFLAPGQNVKIESETK